MRRGERAQTVSGRSRLVVRPRDVGKPVSEVVDELDTEAGLVGQGHVPGAVNIPYEEITGRIGEVTDDKDALIYLYCRSGRRSGIAKSALDQAGFSQVVNIGGFDNAKREAARLKNP